MRGRPKGTLSGKYKNERGEVVGVMEWRRSNHMKRHPADINKLIREIQELTGVKEQEAVELIVRATKKYLQTLITLE